MAKTMARIANGSVVNVEWVSDDVAETDCLVNLGDVPAGIGDSYMDGAFYRDGEKILSDVERLKTKINDYENLINELYSEVTAE